MKLTLSREDVQWAFMRGQLAYDNGDKFSSCREATPLLRHAWETGYLHAWDGKIKVVKIVAEHKEEQ